MRLLPLLCLTGCVATTPTGDWSGEADCPPSNADVAVHFSLEQVDDDLARGDGDIRWDSPFASVPRVHVDFDLDVRTDADDPEQLQVTYSECYASFGTTDYVCPLDGGVTWEGDGHRLRGSFLLWAWMEDFYGAFDCSFDVERESGP